MAPAKKLSDLLAVPAACDRPIGSLTVDSRQVRAGDVFLAYPGAHADGRHYLEAALANGAAAVLLEAEQAGIEWRQGVPCIAYPGLGAAVGLLAARFYGHPAERLDLIGVTGTNGKTSVSHFIAQALPAPCGLLGTLGYGVVGALQAGINTTPDGLQLQRLFAELVAQGAHQAVMEVSSHSLVQQRVAGLGFAVAVFTNLSRDHLDYHGSLAAYAAAKQRLFTDYPVKTAVINRDDAFGCELMASLPVRVPVLSYSLVDPGASVYGEILETRSQGYQMGLSTPQGDGILDTQLLGAFNLSNLLAALGALLALQLPLATALQRLARVQAVPGRMEVFHCPARPTVVVDYAHTPDALSKALQALRPHCQGRLFCVFGCGGDRDRGKRPLMGAAAETSADVLLITDDNPRHETSAAIIAEIHGGLQRPDAARVMPDRAQAISTALAEAGPSDVVLVAGKGHETYQEVGSQRLPFSDRIWVSQQLGLAC